MQFENTEIWGFEHAVRGMRNPMESWDKADTITCDLAQECDLCPYNKNSEMCMSTKAGELIIGNNDMKLAQRLIIAGDSHRKFLRQIFVSVDITAPIYWWKDFDTYKVGVTANSTSTMHKLASTPISIERFECSEHTLQDQVFIEFIAHLESLRRKYLDTNDKSIWKTLIQELPESWCQKRTVTMNYENVRNMVKERQNHKQTEWSVDFINWAKSLKYAGELLFLEENKNE